MAWGVPKTTGPIGTSPHYVSSPNTSTGRNDLQEYNPGSNAFQNPLSASYVIIDKNGTTEDANGNTVTDYRELEHGDANTAGGSDPEHPEGDPVQGEAGNRKDMRKVPKSKWTTRNRRGYVVWCAANKELAAGERIYLGTGSGGARKFWRLTDCAAAT